MTNTYDKIYTVTSISHLIPVKLDLSKLNYAHWKQLFTTHCKGFDVSKFTLGTSTSEEQATDAWIKADAVVTIWIYNMISESLLERVLNSEPVNSHAAWIFLEKIFQDNKLSKTMELNAELSALPIGVQTVEEYFRKLDRIATHLRNLGSTIEDSALVMYVINGLIEKYPHAERIILHRQPFPDLDTARSMLLIEEMALNREQRTAVATLLNSSNPTALITPTATPTPPTQTQTCRNL
ncbi:uncharacterized protein [Rutidosis leptorrhynchoides]|uniref:uncharacterized protein n=1 Tax=Rutidosis leptorrhynchoides TaxID=125765 RepID=UPI003A992B28